MGQRATDYPAGFAAVPQPLPVPFRGWVAVPQTNTEIDQRASQDHAAFPADTAVTAPPSGFVLGRGQPGGPIQLRGARPAFGVPNGRRVVAGPHHTPAGDGKQGCEPRLGQQLRDVGLSSLQLLLEAGQQPEIGREDLPGAHRIWAWQRVPGGGDQPVSDRATHPQAVGGGEADEPGRPEGGEPMRVSEVLRNQPAHPVLSTFGNAKVKPGKQRSS